MELSLPVARQAPLSATTFQPAAFAVEDQGFPRQICGAVIQTFSNAGCWSSAKLWALPGPQIAPSVIMVEISVCFMTGMGLNGFGVPLALPVPS